jgi:hypothetical protein
MLSITQIAGVSVTHHCHFWLATYYYLRTSSHNISHTGCIKLNNKHQLPKWNIGTKTLDLELRCTSPVQETTAMRTPCSTKQWVKYQLTTKWIPTFLTAITRKVEEITIWLATTVCSSTVYSSSHWIVAALLIVEHPVHIWGMQYDRCHHWAWCRNSDAEVTCRTTSPRASCNIKVMLSKAIYLWSLCRSSHTHWACLTYNFVAFTTSANVHRVQVETIGHIVNPSNQCLLGEAHRKHYDWIWTNQTFQELYNIYAYKAKIPMCRLYHHLHLHQNQQRSKGSWSCYSLLQSAIIHSFNF